MATSVPVVSGKEVPTTTMVGPVIICVDTEALADPVSTRPTSGEDADDHERARLETRSCAYLASWPTVAAYVTVISALLGASGRVTVNVLPSVSWTLADEAKLQHDAVTTMSEADATMTSGAKVKAALSWYASELESISWCEITAAKLTASPASTALPPPVRAYESMVSSGSTLVYVAVASTLY